ncbi:MAG: VOC family protein [Acidimicrobiales bacterium]
MGSPVDVNPINAFASLAVENLSNSVQWYEQLFGVSRRPMPVLAEWSFRGGGGLQVYELPERAGRGSCTIVVDDIDSVADTLRSLGVELSQASTRGELADTVMVRDLDGNSIAFAVPHDAELLR